MITEYGFSDKLGPLRYEDNQEEVFLGHSVSQHKSVSDATAKVIDDETRALVEEGEQRARDVLSEYLDDLHTVAKGLLEYEILSGNEVNRLLAGQTIDRSEPDEPTATTGPRSSVPTSGRQPGKKDRPSGGLEPEPQPQG